MICKGPRRGRSSTPSRSSPLCPKCFYVWKGGRSRPSAPSGNMARPLSRSNFEQVTPAIFVEVPTPGQSVPSPMHLVGSANVFEAVFRAILKTATGRVLASAQVHASSGSGTRGVFDVRVSFTKTCGVGVLIVFNVSPKDGSHQNLVRIPVALSSSCERGPVVMAGRSALNAVQPTQRLARASFPGVISVGFP